LQKYKKQFTWTPDPTKSDLFTQLKKQYNLLGMLTGTNGTGCLRDTVVNQSTFKDAQFSRLQFDYNLLLSGMELCRLAGIRWW